MDVTYAEWSAQVIERIASREEAAGYRAMAEQTDPHAELEETTARRLADSFCRLSANRPRQWLFRLHAGAVPAAR
jgi:predicted YcjX-like family ATPase